MRKPSRLTVSVWASACFLILMAAAVPLAGQEKFSSGLSKLRHEDWVPSEEPDPGFDERVGGEVFEKTACSPVVSRYPVASRHNHGYDYRLDNGQTWSWNCSGYYSASDFVAGSHIGNDIFGARGTPIVAAQSGTIYGNFYNSGGGTVVYILDGCGWFHYYAHLDSRDPALYIGKYVTAGTRLGTLGNSGSASGTEPHLHYSVYPDNWNNYNLGVDPYIYGLSGAEYTACQSGNSCSCLDGINVKGYSIPVTDTDCGHRVCGLSNELWECGWSQSWSKVIGESCTSACTCTGGLFKNGREIPTHMTHCKMRVCGTDGQYWTCLGSGGSGGWHPSGIGCS